MTCPICSNDAPYRLSKGIVKYYQCSSCKTLFCWELDNSNMVGGGNEIQRNEIQNHERIARIGELTYGMAKEEVYILDYGCGTGYLIEDLKKAGYPNVDGFDAYSEKYSRLPEKNKYHVVTMIEVIEHTSSPFVEVDVIYRSLKKGGALMTETSFINIAEEEGIDLAEFFYVEPSVGHSTIFSHHGIDLLLALKSFRPLQHWNRNVRLHQKIEK